ncbi:MAG: hypothetical protein RXO43_00670 [Candidatus Micrarchaeota archaeon]
MRFGLIAKLVSAINNAATKLAAKPSAVTPPEVPFFILLSVSSIMGVPSRTPISLANLSAVIAAMLAI